MANATDPVPATSIIATVADRSFFNIADLRPLTKWVVTPARHITPANGENSLNIGMSDNTEQLVTNSVPTPTVKREPNGRWLPGSVPNPGGRPKSPIIDGKTANQRLSEMVPRALEIQAELLENPSTSSSLKNSIAQSILDRVIGKAVNQIDVTSVNLTQTVSNSRIDASALSLDQLRLLASIDAMIADDVNGDDS